ESLIDDGALDRLDGHRRLVDAEYARTFARRRTDAAGELREVVGLMQAIERLTPQSAINKIVPLRNEVIDGAAGGHALQDRAGVTERHAAVHAASALGTQLLHVGVLVELGPIVNALRRLPHQRQLAWKFEKSRWLTHSRNLASKNGSTQPPNPFALLARIRDR